MKKLLGLLLVVIVGFTACEGPEGPPGKDGFSGFYVNDFTVRSSQWQLFYDEEDKPYYEYEIAIPELTTYVFDYGAIVCYLVKEVSYNGGTPFLTQNPLPYTYYGKYSNGDPFSENYSYEVSAGYITFIAKYSDFEDTTQPMDCTFHLVMVWE